MSESIEPVINPIVFDVEKDRDYFWCACGLSKTQPFCDGSHKGSEFSPKKYTAARNERVWFCLCKKTKHAPLCDGTHNKLEKKA